MNSRMIEEFTRRYDARVRYHSQADNVYGYNRTASYHDRFDSTVDVELSYRALEHLVKADEQAELDYRNKREEQHIRARSPAVAEAYSKYKMLLELCRVAP
jgi:beta-lactamase class D